MTKLQERGTGIAWLLAGVLLALSASPGLGQFLSGKSQKASVLLQKGREAFAHGNYTEAATLYQQAQGLDHQLSSREKSDLSNLIQQNDTALKNQQRGRQQLKQAQEALDRGGLDSKAATLLYLASTNQYLSPADRKLLEQLTVRLETGNQPPGHGTPAEAGEPRDYGTLLKDARTALKDNNFDLAEQLAQEAEKANKAGWSNWQLFSDTPAKVLRDVKTARTAAEQTKNPAPPTGTGPAPLQAVKGLFGWKTNSPTKGDGSEEAGPPHGADMAQHHPGLPMPKGPNQPGGPQGHPNPAPAISVKDQARLLVQEGYKALNQGDFQRATHLAQQARALNAGFKTWEDNPEKLLADIERQTPGTAKKPPAGGKTDPHALLQQARELYKQGHLDQAEKLCNQVAAISGVRWPLIGDNPKLLRVDIQNERSKQDRQTATQMLAHARELFNQGNFKEAEDLTYKAEKLYGGYSIWDLGDRPDKLRKEIVAAKLAQKKVEVPTPPDLAGLPLPPVPPAIHPPAVTQIPKPALPPGIHLPPAQPGTNTEQMLAKQKVAELTKQAIQLQKQNRLIEARNVAVEAQKAAVAARKMGVVFGPGDDSPEQLLVHLSGQCKNLIGKMLRDVEKVVANSNDPARFEKAGSLLNQAHQFASAFGLPHQDINNRAGWLQQVQQNSGVPLPPGSPSIAQGPPAMPPAMLSEDHQAGQQMIKAAWTELKAGQTLLAANIAEEAMQPHYGVQKEAAELLRAISLEQLEQRRLTAVRNFQVIKEYIIQHKIEQAKTIAAQIDVSLLPSDMQRQYGELMSVLPSIQPSAVANAGKGVGTPTGSGEPAAKITIKDTEILPTMGSKDPDEPTGFAHNIKVMESILFEKLKSESMAVQIKAQDVFKGGDHGLALDILREYNDQLAHAKLAPDRLKVLQAPIDQRIKKYQVMKAQIDWETEMKQARGKSGFEIEAMRVANKQKRDQQIADLLKQANTLYRERKFEQARMVAMQARDLDPDNVAVHSMLEMANIAGNQDSFTKTEKDKQKHFIDSLEPNYKDMVDAGNPLAVDQTLFKRGMERASKHKKGYSIDHRTEIEKKIDHKLDHYINLKFKDTPLKQAILDLRYLSGLNVVPDTSALADQSISLDATVTLDVENIPMRSALNLLLKQVNLTYVIKDNVLQITTHEHARGKLLSVTYPVGDLVIAPSSAMKKPMTTLEDLLMQSSRLRYGGPQPMTHPLMLPGGQPVSSYNDPSASNFAASNPASAAMPPSGSGTWTKYNPDQTIHDQLIKLITATVEPTSWAEVGGQGTINYFPLGMGLVVNQTEGIQEQIQDLLVALRRLQELEVAIEIRLVSVSESFFEHIGLDFDINLKTNQGRFEPQLVGQQFQPFGFVNRFLPDGFVSGMTPAGTFTPDLNIPIRSSSIDYTLPPMGLGGFPGALGANGGLSLGLAFLSDIQVFMFLEAAQGSKRANAMQAPRVTVFNGQQAFLSVFDTLPVLVNLQENLGLQGEFLFFTPIVQQVPLNLGQGLIVQPVVTADRRYVRLAITMQMTNLVSTNVPLIPIQIPFFDAVFGQQQPSTQAKVFQVFLQQPSTANIFIQTTVTVPDGGTVLLGGLKTMVEQRNEFGPPVLSKIPYINRLFRNVGYGREANSLLMMVTPRIIINEEEELIHLGELEAIPRF